MVSRWSSSSTAAFADPVSEPAVGALQSSHRRQRRVIVRKAALATVAVATALVFPVAAGAGSVHLEQHVLSKSNVQVSIVVRGPAAFHVLLRTRTIGRTQLFLIGKNAPKGGPLMDTSTMQCDGAAGSYYCEGSYEPLPAGTYTFKVVRKSGPATNIELTVTW